MRYEEQVRIAIKNTIVPTEQIEAFDVERNLSDVGVDSISFVRIIVEIEDMLKIEFPFDELVLSESGSIKNICKIIENVKG